MSLPERQQEKECDVFISYSRKDKTFAQLLYTELSSYKPPKLLPVPQRYLKAFLDVSDAYGSDYEQAIHARLKDAAKLLVVCSPSARGSRFVDPEIRTFLKDGASNEIISLIIDGLPNNEADGPADPRNAFPAALCEAQVMPLAIDYRGFDPRKHRINQGTYHNAWFTLLANIYGHSRADIEERERKRLALQRRIRMAILSAVGTALLLLCIWALWSRTDTYQIRSAVKDGGSILRSVQEGVAQSWLESLVLSGQVKDAIEQARSIADAEDRTHALTAVAHALARSNQAEKAMAMVDEALPRAAVIQDPFSRSSVLATLALALGEASASPQAQSTAVDSWKAAMQIGHAQLRAQALTASGRAAVAAHDADTAVAIARDLANAARQVDDQPHRAFNLTSAAAVLFRSGLPISDSLVIEALAVSDRITSLRIQAETLANMAIELADAGLKEHSHSLVARAFAAAKGLNGALRVFVLVSRILPALEKVGARSAMQEAVRMALDDALALAEPASRARSIASVMPWLVKLEPGTDAQAVAQNAWDAIGEMDPSDARIDVTAAVAHELAKARVPLAERVADAAFATATGHSDDRGRSVAFEQIAAAYAELGDLRRARLAAVLCTSSTDRVAAYGIILRHARATARVVK